jgi:hypothetical protein
MDSENWLRDNYLPYELSNDNYIKHLESLSEEGLKRVSEDLFTKMEICEIAHTTMFRYHSWS